ncbi:helix-turn-helix domain-containing protein [Oscillatoria sp. FACHB-1407]|uniref:helix-turn-helix domain-containing protein n=1 Tax=Oscillatoria sp. FACHB-1407 TaxID=2692847 RepID=UPI001688646B|nr:helix-turn-helix domain-containing protein [Oscillatoria sp. FACHB-1407]MBD2461810.1 helix-turn-helix domain-containing protein [Oscillatoria sp. FACHB-1407]
MSVQSSLEEINEIIKSNNPFDGRLVVKSQQVWGEEFPDVPLLHAHASNRIIEIIEKMKSGNLSTFGVALLAPKGIGKSHVLSRIRHHVQEQGGGLFVYMCEYGNLSHIKQQFLQGLAASLRKRGAYGVMQCQEIATALVKQALQKDFTPQQLVNQFHRILAKNPKITNQLTEKILLKVDVSDPNIIQALVWTLSPTHAPFAINWLAGRELTQAQAEVMNLPNSTREDKEVSAFDNAYETLNLVGHYMTPVICFDELDGAEFGDEDDCYNAGYTRAQIVANLAKDLYNNLKKGLIVTSMYQSTFTTEVRTLSGANAVEDRIAQETIELNTLKSEETIELVSGWLEDFYARYGLTPPHKVYPFDEKHLKEIGSGATIREVLRWCADNFGTSIDVGEKIERIYQETEESIEDFLEDNEKITNALTFAFSYLKNQTLENVTIEDLDKEVVPKSENKGFIKFKVLGKENNQDVKIGVSVLQDAHGKTVSAGLRRLTQYQTFNITRGCLIRSKTIDENWDAYKELQKLLKEMGGEWILLKEEEVRPLIALRTISRELENYGFKEEQFYQFIDQNRLILDNPLIREILSDPSGQIPDEATDEDAVIKTLEAVSEPSSETSSEDVADLVEQTVATPEDTKPDLSQLSKTQLATFELHQQGSTLGRIAQKRRLSRSTITRHFVEMIEMNQAINLDLLVPVRRQVQIRKAIEKTSNISSLRSIREHLSDSYTYDEIQLVRAKYLLERQLKEQQGDIAG